MRDYEYLAMKIKFRNQITLFLMCTALAASCATPNLSYIAGKNEQRAEILAAANQFYDAADIYIGLATQAIGAERDRLTLLAIEQWLFAGDERRARNALSQIQRPSSGELLWLWTADVSALLLWEGNPNGALSLLEPLEKETLPPKYRNRLDLLLADSWFQKGRLLSAVGLYNRRESKLLNLDAIRHSRKKLWAQLRLADVQNLHEAANASTDPITRGWLTLAAAANSTGERGISWRDSVENWYATNRNHPAIEILNKGSLPKDSSLNYPKKIALLLPLSGANEAAGNAIQHGFLGAYFAAASGLDNQQTIRSYDVNGEGGLEKAYTSGLEDGADFVVGPLLRKNVAKLVTTQTLSVPVLSLNYLADGWLGPGNLYQFALAPEDEATAVAARALDDQNIRGAALVPANDWGQRMLNTFSFQFEKADGALIDYQRYEPLAQDFSFEIEKLLGLSDSVGRYQRLRTHIGQPLQFDPRRRQDIDFIFLAADSKVGRLIKSQLKFHYAGDLPVYSTSYIYSMDGKSDSDLTGVMFTDAPWIIAPPPWIADFPTTYEKYWPSERRLARLHAMGYDAYHLVSALFNARGDSISEIPGATGRLFLTADRKIHRRLEWAQFDGEQPAHLPQRYDGHRNFDKIKE
tara:strand:- start:501 stop:2408 length:1908 start_codon:yes stop_codon:yes gene_type:complete